MPTPNRRNEHVHPDFQAILNGITAGTPLVAGESAPPVVLDPRSIDVVNALGDIISRSGKSLVTMLPDAVNLSDEKHATTVSTAKLALVAMDAALMLKAVFVLRDMLRVYAAQLSEREEA